MFLSCSWNWVTWYTKWTYKLVNKVKEEVIDGNITFSSKSDGEVENNFKTMLLMHWLPKIPTATRFIVQSRKYSTKGLSKAVTKAFKLIFKQNKNFYENLHFRFWGAENS